MRRNLIQLTAVLVLGVGFTALAAWAAEPESKPSTKAPVDEKLKEKIKQLVAQLGHEDFAVREEATRQLADIGRPAVHALREALKHSDAEVRMRARRILDRIETSVAHLIEDLKDDDANVRKNACEALERVGPPAKEAVPVLVEVMTKDKNTEVREAAMMALLAIDPDNKALVDAAPAKARVNGKYTKLLRRIKVEGDKASYGEFSDYGHYTGTSYAGHSNLPPGYWVYVAPHWYIWGEMKNK